MNARDLTGMRFGRLEALRRSERKDAHGYIWICRCDCGNICEAPTYLLTSGRKRSCGCLQDETRRGDVTGQKRGHLTAIRPTDQRRNGSTVWVWRCDCGAEVLKALELVSDTGSTMCPACARKLKSAQASAMFANQERDEYGMPPAATENVRAGKLPRNNTSGVRGVNWHAGSRKWVARISDKGRLVTLGYFDRIEDAAEARRRAVEKKYGKSEDDRK